MIIKEASFAQIINKSYYIKITNFVNTKKIRDVNL